MNWEERAKIIYEGHHLLEKAVVAGKLMDARLNTVKHTGPYGSVAYGGVFDIQQFLAYFDDQRLKAIGLNWK